MTIKEITEQSIEQTCDFCGHVQSSNLDHLTVGVATENQINADVVQLPPCENCGAIEYLLPLKDNGPEHRSPGSLGHRHAMLVDVLHERLVTSGHVIKELDPEKLGKKKHTQEELNRWFTAGLKLERPVPPDPQPEAKKDGSPAGERPTKAM